MKTMEGILKQELARLRETEKGYIREIAKLPRGTLQKKQIKGKSYLYLVSSKNSNLSYKCVSNLPEEELKKLRGAIVLRKKYQDLLRGVRQDIARITKIVYGKKRTV